MKKIICTLIALAVTTTVIAQPKLVAHRGFYKAPGADENTIAALHNAQKLGGLYGVEFDINLTADGEVIVAHGSKILGTNLDAQKDTWAEIQKVTLPNGNKVPTLREWLAEAKKQPNLKQICEIKKHATPEIETKIIEILIATINELGMMEQMEFTSFSYHACKECVRLAPGRPVLYLNSSLSTKVDADVLATDRISGMSYSMYVFMNMPHLVDQCQAKGIETTLWIVNHPEVVDWAVKHRIDYISSDYPDKMKAYLNSPAVKKTAKKAGY
jgi:glycerophosphoryl diester phosphodiesterase